MRKVLDPDGVDCALTWNVPRAETLPLVAGTKRWRETGWHIFAEGVRRSRRKLVSDARSTKIAGFQKIVRDRFPIAARHAFCEVVPPDTNRVTVRAMRISL